MRPVDPVLAAEAVFSVVERHVGAGETAQIRNSLPEEVRDLWRSDVAAEASATQEIDP